MFKELGAPNIYPAAAVKCFGEQKVLVFVRNTKVVTFVFITEEHDWETRKGVTGNERNGGWGGEGKATFLFTLPVPFDSFQVKLVQHGG